MSRPKSVSTRDEVISVSSQHLASFMDFGEPEEKRARRKPNFTVQERLHLAKSYVESYEEYNRGFTPSTKGEAKLGRQRLLEKWAGELSAFGIVERTPVEVEQKIRDYMKKISANRKRAVKRAMSPPCQLISSVVPESSSVDDSTMDDSLTAYAGFLLEQHRATQQNECTENLEPLRLIDNSYDEEVKLMTSSIPALQFETKNTKSTSRKRKISTVSPYSNEGEHSVGLETKEDIPVTLELHKHQLDNARADLALKTVRLDIARKELEMKTLEVETMKINLEIKKLELAEKKEELKKKRFEMEELRRNLHSSLQASSSSGTSGNGQGTPPSDQDDREAEL